MANKTQEDAVINLKFIQELAKDLGFQWTIVAFELGFTRAEIGRFQAASMQKYVQAKKMLESWYEKSKSQENKTKQLLVALERAGRKDLADKLQCLHWGHQKLSSRVELPSAFPFLITVHKTINNREGLQKINQLSHR
ncbi:uncharacterized protein wu:fc50b12 isoform X2 [Pristis pectinata]|uniref:uncharacterized protein wu:fc50b12 isoform X2 n=1 Tax=Pristis pectinata TaxID=685728 RepID=UPI00223CADEA|nr:uncharacterized protein wu:fc50b12 isoform X2 [Pristis pectinata]